MHQSGGVLPAGASSFDAIFTAPFSRVPVAAFPVGEAQGESVCWNPGGGYFTAVEYLWGIYAPTTDWERDAPVLLESFFSIDYSQATLEGCRRQRPYRGRS